jgi:glycosyltransferase involved in cell wall biosynthesis
MKVLFVVQGIVKGGAERLVLDIAQELRRHHPDVSVEIAALNTVNQYPSLTEGLTIHFIRSDIRLSLTGKSVIDIQEYEEIVDRFQPDIIHSHTYKAELVSRENVRPGIKYFTHVHSDFPEFNKFSFKTITSKRAITNLYERWRMLRKYREAKNRFITISTVIHENLLQQLPSDLKQNATLLHNAIYFNRFVSIPKRLPQENNQLKLITVGRLFPHKNQIFLVSVIKYLIEKGYNALLIIVGAGPEQEKIKSEANRLNVANQISFKGIIENVEELYKNSHIYLHSAIYEPFGLVLIEAMAAGLPVVTLDGGGNRDIIEEGKNGFLIPEHDPKKFADAIVKLVSDQNLYSNISAYAIEYARQFDIKNYVEKLLKIYRQ